MPGIRQMAGTGIAIVLLFLWGCGLSHRPAPDRGGPLAEDLLASLEAMGEVPHDFKGISRFRYEKEGQRQSGRLAFVCSPPDRLRFSVLGPFGQTLALVASDGEYFYADLGPEAGFYKKKAGKRILRRILGARVTTDDLVRVLSGRLPAREYKKAAAEPWNDPETGRSLGQVLVLRKSWGRLAQKVWVDGKTGRAVKTALYNGNKEPEMTIFLEQGKDGLPGEVRLENSKEETLLLVPGRFYPDARVYDGQFMLEKPGDKVPGAQGRENGL